MSKKFNISQSGKPTGQGVNLTPIESPDLSLFSLTPTALNLQVENATNQGGVAYWYWTVQQNIDNEFQLNSILFQGISNFKELQYIAFQNGMYGTISVSVIAYPIDPDFAPSAATVLNLEIPEAFPLVNVLPQSLSGDSTVTITFDDAGFGCEFYDVFRDGVSVAQIDNLVSSEFILDVGKGANNVGFDDIEGYGRLTPNSVNGFEIEAFYIEPDGTPKLIFVDKSANVPDINTYVDIIVSELNNADRLVFDTDKYVGYPLPLFFQNFNDSIGQDLFFTLRAQPLTVDRIYIDNSVINGSVYNYNITAQPSTHNDLLQQSSSVQGTPSATIPTKLNPPTNLKTMPTGDDTEVILLWDAPSFADNYDIYLDGLVIGSTANTQYTFTGLTLEQSWELGVVAIILDASIDESDLVEYTYTPTVSIVTTPEQFGANAYMKPLDGRFQFSTQFPLINTTPYSFDNTILDGTGLNNGDYPNGTALVESTLANTFTASDLNKSICVLFNNDNGTDVDYNNIDDFNPDTFATRYANVIYIKSPTEIIIDFEINGGDRINPQPSTNKKAYIFFDNSTSLDNAFASHFASDNTRFNLRELALVTNFEIVAYVAPILSQLNESISTTDTLITTASGSPARIKIYTEDYYYLENLSGSTSNEQPEYIINLGGGNQDFVTHAVQWTPPHRWLKAGNPRSIGLFTGGSSRVGVTVANKLNNTAELKEIEAGLGTTLEYYHMQTGNVGKGGTRDANANPTLVESDGFHFVYFNEFDFVSVNAGGQMNGSGSQMNIFDNGKLDFNPQSSFAPTFQYTELKVTTDLSGLPDELALRDYYPEAIEIQPSSTANFWATHAKGSNLAWNMAQITRDQYGEGGRFDNTPLVFILMFGGVSDAAHWEFMYRTQEDHNLWGTFPTKPLEPGAGAIQSYKDFYAFRAKKALLSAYIVRVGQRYFIGRDYNVTDDSWAYILGDGAKIQIPGTIFSNSIKSGVSWGTFLGKYAQSVNIVSGLEYDYQQGETSGDWFSGYLNFDDPKVFQVEVPANGRPLALQMGDTFKIVETGFESEQVYLIETLIVYNNGKDNGSWVQDDVNSPASGGGFSAQVWYQHYNYNNRPFMNYRLDIDLPDGLPTVFEIEILSSATEILLDGNYRDSIITYKGTNSGIGSSPARRTNGDNAGLTDQSEVGQGAFPSNASGHLAYTQGEITKYFRNVDFNSSFWRENNNKEAVTETFEDWEGNDRSVRSLATESKGLTYIDCTNVMIGEIGAANGGSTASHVGFGWERQRMIYEKYGFTPDWVADEGMQFPPKMRVYNTEDVANRNPINESYSLEEFPTNVGAPDLPTKVLDVLSALP